MVTYYAREDLNRQARQGFARAKKDVHDGLGKSTKVRYDGWKLAIGQHCSLVVEYSYVDLGVRNECTWGIAI